MTKLITLGVELAGIYRPYTRIHSTVFGKASYRLILDAVTGPSGATYRRAVRDLNVVERELRINYSFNPSWLTICSTIAAGV